MRTPLPRLGAAALAVTTIATGLGFGSAAATAAPTDTTAGPQTTQVIFDAGDRFVTPSERFSDPIVGHLTYYKTAQSIAAARQLALHYTIAPTTGDWVRLQLGNACLSMSNHTKPFLLAAATDCTTSASEWRIDGSTLTSRTAGAVGQVGALPDGTLQDAVIGTGAADLVAAPDVFKAAALGSRPLDLTAVVEGEGRDGTTIRVNGSEVATITRNAWGATIRSLTIGDNALTVEQWDGDTKLAETVLHVEITVRPVTATARNGLAWADRMLVEGTAQPGATVQIRNADDLVVATTTSDRVFGRWDVELPSPNAGGVYHLTANQLIGSGENTQRNGSTEFAATYGAAVAADSPEVTHDGGTLTLTGTGEPRAAISVYDQEDPNVPVGSAIVRTDGTWTLDVRDLGANEYTLAVKQVGRSGNTTATEVAVNSTSDVADLVVSTPTVGSSMAAPAGGSPEFPNAKVRFTGEGEPNAEIEVFRDNGRSGGTTTADADGHWEADVNANWVTYRFFDITQTMGDNVQTERVKNVTITKDQSFTVGNLQSNSTVEAPAGMSSAFPNAKLHVTGTGSDGSTVTFLRQNGKAGGSTTVENGVWALDADINWGKWNLSVVQSAPGQADTTAALKNVTIAQQTETHPLTVTSPLSGKDVAGPTDPRFPNAKVTFTGTGTPDATITVIRKHNGREAAVGTVGSDGTFTVDADFNWGSWSAIVNETTSEDTRTVVVDNFTVLK